MKLFGKELSGKAARDLITRLVLIVVSGAILVISAVTTAAWFSHNTTVNDTGMQIVVSTDRYKLIVKRTTEYDRVISSNPVYPGVAGLKNELEDVKEYSLTAMNTNQAGAIAFELKNEYSLTQNGVTTYYLRPGAYGTLTFYIQTDTPVNIDFSFLLGGYNDAWVWKCNNLSCNHIDHSADVPASCSECSGTSFSQIEILEEVTSSTTLNYLKGHLLFFEGRSGADYEHYVYSDQLSAGTFSYNTSTHSALTSGDIDTIFAGCTEDEITELKASPLYKVELYWEWPMTYSDINEDISTTSPAVTKRYPASVRSFINDNENFFFANDLDVDVNTLEELDNGYNDADQYIGDHVDYIVVYIDTN